MPAVVSIATAEYVTEDSGEGLAQETCRNGFADGEIREAEAFIKGTGRQVILPDFECELATTADQGLLLGLGEECPPDALSAAVRNHGKVVDVEQRARLKRRKADEADGHPNRSFAFERQQHQRVPLITQSRDETFANVFAQRLAAADRIGGVGVEHSDDAGAIVRIVEICFTDLYCHSTTLIRINGHSIRGRVCNCKAGVSAIDVVAKTSETQPSAHSFVSRKGPSTAEDPFPDDLDTGASCSKSTP
jgi:hypothetical protein